MKRLQGFSLMEMMIVLTIVAIVAAASAPMVNKKMVRAASERSPWVFTNGESIGYNIDNPNGIQDRKTATIGRNGRVPNNGGHPRLYIDTSSHDIPHILFGTNGGQLFRLLVGGNEDNFWGNIILSSINPTYPLSVARASVAIGDGASVNSLGDVAIGAGSWALEDGSVAIGRNTRAGKIGSIAIGSDANAGLPSNSNIVQYNTAIGSDADARGRGSIALGHCADASANRAIAIGSADEGSAVFRNNDAVPDTSAKANFADSIAIGSQSKAVGVSGIAIGSLTSATSSSVAFGNTAVASANNAIAIGRSASVAANASNSIATGYFANVGENSTDSIALGRFASIAANSSNVIALGCSANIASNSSNSIAIGYLAYPRAREAIAIGNNTRSGLEGVAIGTSASANKSYSIAIGSNSRSSADLYGIALGDSANVAANYGIAIGHIAEAKSQYSIALGDSANSTNYASTAIGYRVVASGERSIAIGYDDWTKAEGNDSIAIGYMAQASAKNATAIGPGAQVSMNNTIVLGTVDDLVYIPGKLVVGKTAVLGFANGQTNSANDITIIRSGRGDGEGGSQMEILQRHDDGDFDAVYATQARIGYDWTKILENHATSDRRLKNVGKAFTSGLDKIKKLEVFNYTFKDDKDKTPRVGVMAQDLQKIFPDAVVKGEDGFLRIRMEDMFYAVINAIKELDIRTSAQEKKIKELEKQNKELLKRIEALEKRV